MDQLSSHKNMSKRQKKYNKRQKEKMYGKNKNKNWQ